MNRAFLWNCFDLLMLTALLFAAAMTGCGPVHRADYDGTRERVTRSRPAPLGSASTDSTAISNGRANIVRQNAVDSAR